VLLYVMPVAFLCRARLQIKKEEEELQRAFGTGPVTLPKGPQPHKGPKAPKGTAQLTAAPGQWQQQQLQQQRQQPSGDAEILGEDGGDDGDGKQQQQQQQRLTTVQLFGDSKAVEKAVAMIEEATANKDQKQKQRQAQYERKRDQKRRDRCAQDSNWGEACPRQGSRAGSVCCAIPPSLHNYCSDAALWIVQRC
jgi:hypothetical protein